MAEGAGSEPDCQAVMSGIRNGEPGIRVENSMLFKQIRIFREQPLLKRGSAGLSAADVKNDMLGHWFRLEQRSRAWLPWYEEYRY